MLKNLQNNIVLWVQAKSGLSSGLLISLAVAGGAAVLAFVFLCVKWSRRGPSAAWLGAYATAPGRFFGHNADTKSQPPTLVCARHHKCLILLT
jgi:hypothetical protein